MADAAPTGTKMQFKNKEIWEIGLKANTDGYGRACYTYAQRWAEMMEEKIRGGLKLEDIAKSTSHDADKEGITGFMYGMAVNILASVWEHGEELRKWHNLDTQIRDEGEKANKEGMVLNPALLNVSTKEP